MRRWTGKPQQSAPRRHALTKRLSNRTVAGSIDRLDAINEDVEGYVVDELNSVRDSIRSAVEKQIGIKDPLISSLLNLLIEDVLMKPIAAALDKARAASGSSGILGGLFSAVGSIFGGGSGIGTGATSFASTTASLRAEFGRASGGYVNAGQAYRVNEAASPGRVEAFVPQDSGKIIPLGQMSHSPHGRAVGSPGGDQAVPDRGPGREDRPARGGGRGGSPQAGVAADGEGRCRLHHGASKPAANLTAKETRCRIPQMTPAWR
ncbi:hypothetical protein [Novosphingobium sp. EMRT-2]|uniref:hypothetical protein n=1 Tax=Novosphingobium sp. EMRT-2 TaxID=2571749 RepID=UPI0010BD8146|nr:hypothetical protein [Novosphingobium sp. EMRT-2]QCI95169.1 hypothetical protein FA702_17755 [Novosphingobium sp. EMRT-2]